jgi:site-specific DNA-adenine methylase
MTTQQNGLKPFFSYFGSKWRTARRYPQPLHPHIIEPFAGSAGYALHYPHLQVTLYDLNEIICGVWDYLIRVSATELASLPTEIQHIDDLDLCQEAKWLLGFWMNKGATAPRKTPCQWAKDHGESKGFWGPRFRQRLVEQVEHIRHWKIVQASYTDIINRSATWFIDPPYQTQGKHYKHNDIDYGQLNQWCQERDGQVIVCEASGADWLPFRFLVRTMAVPHRRIDKENYSHELIWTKNCNPFELEG